jgi:hypothetical protein
VPKPEEAIDRAGKYASADWEQRMAKASVTTSATLDNALDARALVIGVTVSSASRAYPFEALLKQSPIIDELGRVPIMIVMADDHKSVRAFERTAD